jgi:hypothetical protein
MRSPLRNPRMATRAPPPNLIPDNAMETGSRPTRADGTHRGAGKEDQMPLVRWNRTSTPMIAADEALRTPAQVGPEPGLKTPVIGDPDEALRNPVRIEAE